VFGKGVVKGLPADVGNEGSIVFGGRAKGEIHGNKDRDSSEVRMPPNPLKGLAVTQPLLVLPPLLLVVFLLPVMEVVCHPDEGGI
jgi:hypothetical protein